MTSERAERERSVCVHCLNLSSRSVHWQSGESESAIENDDRDDGLESASESVMENESENGSESGDSDDAVVLPVVVDRYPPPRHHDQTLANLDETPQTSSQV